VSSVPELGHNQVSFLAKRVLIVRRRGEHAAVLRLLIVVDASSRLLQQTEDRQFALGKPRKLTVPS
jgi:hypothetical protein